MKNRVRTTSRKAILLRTMQIALTLTLCACSQIQPPSSLVKDTQVRAINTNNKEDTEPTDKAAKAPAEPFLPTGMDRYSGFNAAYKNAREHPEDAIRNAKFLTEGMALVQASCSSYFTRLGNDGQHLGFARKETTLAGGMAAALLGLFDTSAKVISATAAGFGFTTASMDNFSETYLFSPDIRAVQDLVVSALEAQRTIGAGIATEATAMGGNTLTYTQVNQFLLEMESYCQPHGVRSLITKAVNTQKAAPAFTPGSVAQLEQSMKDFQAAAAKIKETLDTTRAESAAQPSAAGQLPRSAMRSQALILQTK